MRTLVVVPTYCEQDTVGTVLRRVRTALPDADVLVVDDGSTDATCDVVRSVAAELGGIELFGRTGARGLGRAHAEGMRAAAAGGYDVLCQIDADLSHDESCLPEMLQLCAGEGTDGSDAHVTSARRGREGRGEVAVARADLAIGSRYVPGGTVLGWSRPRRWLSQWGNRYAAVVLGLDVCDATAGLRAIRVDALAAIGPDRLRSAGHAFQIESTYRAVRAGCSIVEVPTVFRDRAAGRSKMRLASVVEAAVLVTAWALRDLFTLRRWRPLGARRPRT